MQCTPCVCVCRESESFFCSACALLRRHGLIQTSYIESYRTKTRHTKSTPSKHHHTTPPLQHPQHPIHPTEYNPSAPLAAQLSPSVQQSRLPPAEQPTPAVAPHPPPHLPRHAHARQTSPRRPGTQDVAKRLTSQSPNPNRPAHWLRARCDMHVCAWQQAKATATITGLAGWRAGGLG